MRILQVATLVSPDGAYGGPVRVALNQCTALQEMGHNVALAAGCRGYDTPPLEIQGVPAQLFKVRQVLPRTGFAGLSARDMRRWFRRNRRSFDVVHVHLARDLVTMPIAIAALRAGIPLVVQTHGMVDASDKVLGKLLDSLVTRRILRNARAVLFLTERERTDLITVAGNSLELTHLVNGVPFAEAQMVERADEVLFLARLHPRKRPLEFVKTAIELAEDFPSFRFTLLGPDEGEGPAVAREIERAGSTSIAWDGPIPPNEVVDRMRRCAVYVLPSVDEPFPMSVLEAMSVGTPVIVTETCGLAEALERSGAGLVADGTEGSLTRTTRQLLIAPAARSLLGENGIRAARDQFSILAIATRLEDVYAKTRR